MASTMIAVVGSEMTAYANMGKCLEDSNPPVMTFFTDSTEKVKAVSAKPFDCLILDFYYANTDEKSFPNWLCDYIKVHCKSNKLALFIPPKPVSENEDELVAEWGSYFLEEVESIGGKKELFVSVLPEKILSVFKEQFVNTSPEDKKYASGETHLPSLIPFK